MLQMQNRHRIRIAPILIATVFMGCSGIPESDTTATTSSTTTPTTTTTTTTTATTTTTTTTVETAPLAIWFGTGSEAATPETAADAAIQNLFGIVPVLGPYMAGDSQSGEIEVYSPIQNSGFVRSLLQVRKLDSSSDWSVLAGVNSEITIDAPASGNIYTPGPLTVSGTARGSEGTVLVTAHRVGGPPLMIDLQIAAGGSLGVSAPFSVVLDLSSTNIGDVIAIIVRGDSGLSDDTGEFTAIPILIG
jgi:hypothetical protein